MYRICNFISRWVAVLIMITALGSILWPDVFGIIKPDEVPLLLGIVMLGMGLTMSLNDFHAVITHPREVLVGTVSQFFIMPMLAFVLTQIFNLPTDLAVGVVLVGCCPGGTASNVMTYLAKGDLALSVGITSMSTILAPFMTPLLVWLIIGKEIDVEVMAMFLSILQVIILPILLGILINHFFPRFTAKATGYLPAISSLSIMCIVAAVVSASSQHLIHCGFEIIAIVILHNLFGFLLGYEAARLFRMSPRKCTAVSIEVGMQNSGLACSLAAQHFASLALAPIPGAVFSVWHNVSGAIAARVFERKNKEC